MPKVSFARVGLEIEVPLGATILEAAEEVGAPEGSHCGGVQACSTCHVHVEQGGELLSAQSDDERELIELSAWAPGEDSRLGCQAAVVTEGEVVVRISDESFETWLEANPDKREAGLKLWLG